MVTKEEAHHFSRQKIATIKAFLENKKIEYGEYPKYVKMGVIEEASGETVWYTEKYDEFPRCQCGREMKEGVLANADHDSCGLSWWRWFCVDENCARARASLVRDRVVEYRRGGHGTSQMEQALAKMNVPTAYKEKTLYDLDNSKAVRFAREVIRSNDNLLIIGGTGVGKTHLAVGLLIEYGRMSPNRFRFENVPSMIMSLNAAIRRNEDYTLIVETLEGYDTLVLDDLGAEKTTEYVRSILYQLLNGRLLMSKQTIITTNLTLDQINERIDERLASRLSEYRTLIMKGPDARRTRKAG